MPDTKEGKRPGLLAFVAVPLVAAVTFLVAGVFVPVLAGESPDDTGVVSESSEEPTETAPSETPSETETVPESPTDPSTEAKPSVEAPSLDADVSAVEEKMAPAEAEDEPFVVNLNPAHVGSEVTDTQQDCSDLNPGDNEDGWHFVVPGEDAVIVSITVTFDTGVVTIPGGNGSINDRHAYIFTPAGATLLGATATVTGNPENVDNINLSHGCPGTPPTSSTPPPTTTTPPPTSSTPPPTTETPSTSTSTPVTSTSQGGGGAVNQPKDKGGLPTTGVAIAGYVLGAALLIGGGIGAVVFARRRAAGN